MPHHHPPVRLHLACPDKTAALRTPRPKPLHHRSRTPHATPPTPRGRPRRHAAVQALARRRAARPAPARRRVGPDPKGASRPSGPSHLQLHAAARAAKLADASHHEASTSTLFLACHRPRTPPPRAQPPDPTGAVPDSWPLELRYRGALPAPASCFGQRRRPRPPESAGRRGKGPRRRPSHEPHGLPAVRSGGGAAGGGVGGGRRLGFSNRPSRPRGGDADALVGSFPVAVVRLQLD